MSLNSWYEAWNFFLPASVLPFGLYALWVIFGQESVLPLDLRYKLGKNRLIGDGRGWSSLLTCLVLAGLVGVYQGRGDEALVLGLGAHFGVTLNSAIKRACGVRRGVTVPLADNIDFVLGACLFYALQFEPLFTTFIQGIAVCGTAHWLVSGLVRGALRNLEPGA